mmetsp:Transcript_23568/g.67382  ORF Transcript_23568/g.67382 Transcript_23568/m.67382 type:complete len:271 (+) Transcript_23568:734-1546(+)
MVSVTSRVMNDQLSRVKNWNKVINVRMTPPNLSKISAGSSNRYAWLPTTSVRKMAKISMNMNIRSMIQITICMDSHSPLASNMSWSHCLNNLSTRRILRIRTIRKSIKNSTKSESSLKIHSIITWSTQLKTTSRKSNQFQAQSSLRKKLRRYTSNFKMISTVKKTMNRTFRRSQIDHSGRSVSPAMARVLARIAIATENLKRSVRRTRLAAGQWSSSSERVPPSSEIMPKDSSSSSARAVTLRSLAWQSLALGGEPSEEPAAAVQGSFVL